MKVLMFGRGTIATIYGWALEKSGRHVEFYVRPGRAKEYGTRSTSRSETAGPTAMGTGRGTMVDDHKGGA